MAKVLPAGYGVNLNLGQDPFDRLLKLINTASQVQGMVNQSRLYNEKRDAIKNESIQTMMLNSVTSMDQSDMNSVLGTEASLTEMRDKFISENPHLTDDINTFFSTTMSTTIKPVIKVHQDFERDKNALLSQIDNLDKQVLALDDDIILDGSNTQFKDTFSKLAKSLAFYKNNMARYDKVMPDLNADLAMQADFANTVLTKIPSQLIGVFDGTEQELASQLLRGEITPPMYDAALKNYYAKTSGRTSQIVMPRLAGEMNSLYKDSYLPGFNFLKSIQSGNVALFDPELKGTAKQKNYFDDSTGIYYYNGTQLNEQTDNPKKAKEAAESAMKAMLRPVEIKIKKKDSAYRGYSLETQGEDFSYAQNIAENGSWPWDRPEGFQFQEDVGGNGQIEGMVDKNNNGIPDYIERPEEDSSSLNKDSERVKLRMTKYPKAAEKKLNKVADEVKNFKIEDTSLIKAHTSKIKKLSNLIGKDSEVLNAQDLISLKNLYDSDMKEIENLQNQISSERKDAKKAGVGLSEGFPPRFTEPGKNIKQLREKIQEIEKRWGGANKKMTLFLMNSIKQYDKKKSQYDTVLNQYNKIINTLDTSKQN